MAGARSYQQRFGNSARLVWGVLRVVVSPFVVVLYAQGQSGAAAALFLVVAVGQSVGERLIRLRSRVTTEMIRLGDVINPIADRLIVMMALVTLMGDRRVPLAYAALVFVRAAALAVGLPTLVWGLKRPVRYAEPIWARVAGRMTLAIVCVAFVLTAALSGTEGARLGLVSGLSAGVTMAWAELVLETVLRAVLVPVAMFFEAWALGHLLRQGVRVVRGVARDLG